MRNLVWSIPQKILNDPKYTKIQLWKGLDENDPSSYSILITLDRWENANPSGAYQPDYKKEVASYTDSSGVTSDYYYIKYFDPVNNVSTKILEVINELTPKQVRLASNFRRMVDPLVASIIEVDGTFTPFTDEDSYQSLELGAGFLSSYTARDMSIDHLDKTFEGLLYLASLQLCLLVKGLGISLRDFSYSDNGLSLTQDMGAAVNSAYEKISTLLTPVLQSTKLQVGFDASYTEDLFLGSYNLAIGGGMVGLNRGGSSGRNSQPQVDYGGQAMVDIWNLIR